MQCGFIGIVTPVNHRCAPGVAAHRRSLAIRTVEGMPLHCRRSLEVGRRGVTLLELLVVLVLMGIAAALVVPALRFPSNSLTADDGQFLARQQVSGLISTPEVDGVLANARRIALKRGEPVRLRVASDGVWAIAPLNGGNAIQNGRVTQPLSWQPDLTIDAIGTCVLSANVVPRTGASAWDALACRWRESLP